MPFAPVTMYGDAYSAIVAISKRLSEVVAGGGVYGDVLVASQSWPQNARRNQDVWRFDVEALRGHNLQYAE